MSDKPLVLVTGITGFVAGQVAESFLEAGYRVRGTARGAKAHLLEGTLNVPDLEIVQIDDIAKADFTEALKDVYAVIHVASPLPGRTSADDTITSAVEGTLNVLQQGTKFGITKFVVTGSLTGVLNPTNEQIFAGIELSEKDWGNATLEGVRAQPDNAMYVYHSSKILSEKAVWKFARANPNVDVATILPSFIYGPYAKHFPLPTSASALGTNGFPFALLNGNSPPVIPPLMVDVRDVAKAHVNALQLPKATGDVEEKRFLVNGGNYTWKEAARDLKKNTALPGEVREKIPNVQDVADIPGVASTLDTTRAKEVLKINFIPPEKTLQDAILALVKVQADFI